MLTLLTLLLACASPPQQTHLPSLLACGDQLCQQEHLVAAWKEDPAAVTAYITGQQDELVRTALAGWVARALPGEVGQLCQALEQTTVAWFRCQRLNTRPHLRAEHDFEAVNRGMKHRRPGGGPSGPRMPLPDLPAGTWLDASKEELRTAAGACKKDSWCIQQLADAQAAAGDVHAAGLACLALDSELGEGYHECLFLASEAAVQHTSIDGLGVAFELASCSRFKAFSVSHLLELAAPPAPPSSHAGEEDVAAARAAAVRFAEAARGERYLADLYEDYFWAIWLGTAYHNTSDVRGDLAPHLPPIALPHLHMAAATALIAGRDLRRDFDPIEEAEKLRLALLEQRPLEPGSSARLPPIGVFSRPFWGSELAEERKIPAVFVAGPNRRPTSDDEATDRMLAVLEAAARARRPPTARSYFSLVGSDQPELVRWSGARLGASLDPEAAEALAAATSDESALVLARLLPLTKQQGVHMPDRKGPAPKGHREEPPTQQDPARNGPPPPGAGGASR